MQDLELQPPLSDDLEVTVKNIEVSLSEAQAVTGAERLREWLLEDSGCLAALCRNLDRLLGQQ